LYSITCQLIWYIICFNKSLLSSHKIVLLLKIWHENTKIILKKLNKLNYSILKTYKIITLLNCLNKVAEKIIAVQLSYTAEINDKLLNFDQMRDRKQRSAIDAVLNLVHDAQMTKSWENTLIYLLLNDLWFKFIHSCDINLDLNHERNYAIYMNEQNSLRNKITHWLYNNFNVVKTVSFKTMYHVWIYNFYSACDALVNSWWKCLCCLIILHHSYFVLHK